jgi:hypothetical protein
MAVMSSFRALLAVVVAALACGVVSARADEHVAVLDAATPIAAAGGTVAYSARGADGQYHLMVAGQGGAGAAAVPGVAPSATPFDVALGLDQSGTLTATYSRDQRAYAVRLAGPGTETPMRSIAGRAANPVTSGTRVAWIVPGQGPRGCDRLMVRSGKGRPRAVSSACRTLTGLTIDGYSDRLAWSSADLTGTDGHGAGRKTSSIKAFQFGGKVRTVQTTSFGEEGNVLSSPSISDGRVTYTQTGVHPRPAFVSAGVVPGRPAPRTSPAGVALAGPLAVDGPNAYYLLGPDGEECGDGLAPIPCELVHAATKDLAPGAARRLPPELSVGYTPAVKPPAGTPLTVAGVLQRRTVRDGATLSTTPLAGEVVDVLLRGSPNDGTPESFAPTGLSATTDADGRWSVQVPAPADPYFSAQVRATGLLAGRGTVGYCPAGTTPTGNGGCDGPAS